MPVNCTVAAFGIAVKYAQPLRGSFYCVILRNKLQTLCFFLPAHPANVCCGAQASSKNRRPVYFHPRAADCRGCDATNAHLMKLNWFEVIQACPTRCMAVLAKDFGTHLGGVRESSAREKKTP